MTAEQTALAAKDCWFWQHKWTRWEMGSQKSWGHVERFTGAVVKYDQPHIQELQQRSCVHCGKIQRRKVPHA